MGIIKVLDDSISNIIAAGEVVENPASMIKELIENSIDAKSKKIEININKNGTYVKILDDGIGMDRSDLLMCIERHATSKIKTKEDIFNLLTYGFRGEALSSIASVSKILIKSKQKENEIGYQMTAYGGAIKEVKEIYMQNGTEIEIRDLFYNTPARKKFMKKESTEISKIKDIVLKEALANFNISFSLIIEEKEVFKTTGNGLKQTVYEIFGKNNYKNLYEFKLGFLGGVDILKSTKEYIFTYVNGRYVKSPLLERAIISAYETKLMKGKYPFAIIFLEISPTEIDINIDPGKKYIKFSNDRIVYKQLYDEIKEFFYYKDRESFTAEISISNNYNKENSNLDDYKIEENNEKRYEFDFEKKEEEKLDIKNTLQNYNLHKDNNIINSSIKNKEFLGNKPFYEKQIGIFERSDGSNKSYEVLGQIFNTYILVNNKDTNELEIYDQHIIHEGILYEELLTQFEEKRILKKQLLFPKIVDLLPKEKDILFSNIEIFEQFGFEIDEISENKIAIRTVPDFDFKNPLENGFNNLLRSIINNEFNIRDIREEILISMSCKGAIKSGDKLNMYEMQNMVRRLHEVKRYTCPHGRPIISKITKDELDKTFGRKK